MDAFRRMVGLWVWLVLPGSAGADLQIKEPYGSCNLSSGEENQQGKDTTFIYLQWYIVSYTVSTIVQNFLYLKVALKCEILLEWWLHFFGTEPHKKELQQ